MKYELRHFPETAPKGRRIVAVIDASKECPEETIYAFSEKTVLSGCALLCFFGSRARRWEDLADCVVDVHPEAIFMTTTHSDFGEAMGYALGWVSHADFEVEAFTIFHQ